jgi:hypothetical protein
MQAEATAVIPTGWVIAGIVVIVIVLILIIIKASVKVLKTKGGKIHVNFKKGSVDFENGEESTEEPPEEKKLFTDVLVNHEDAMPCDTDKCERIKAVEVLKLMEKLEEYLNDKWMIRLKLNLRDQMKLVEGKLRYIKGLMYSVFLTLVKNNKPEDFDIINCSESYTYGKALDVVISRLKDDMRERCSDDCFEKISDRETDSGPSLWHVYKQNAWETMQALVTETLDHEYPFFIDIDRKDVYNANKKMIEEEELKRLVLNTFNNLRDIAIKYDNQINNKKEAYQEEVKKVFK